MSRQLYRFFIILILTGQFIFAAARKISRFSWEYPVNNQILITQKSTDNWWAKDKLKHFSMAFYLTMSSYYYQNRIFNVNPEKASQRSGLTILSLGIGKELYDHYRPNSFFSVKDLVADLSGVCVGLLLINRIG